MLLREPVQAIIWDALNSYSYKNAIWLAERLYAEVSSSECLHLLATCYYRSGHITQAYLLLLKHGCSTPQCKFLMANCCLESKRYSEAERMLAGNTIGKSSNCSDIEAEFGVKACYVFALLGLLYSKTDRVQRACECYKRSLKLNPLLWKSYEALCQLGAKVDPSVVFAMPPGMTLPSSCSACAFASQINVSLCCSGSKMHQMASAEASLSAARSVPTSISTPADTAVSQSKLLIQDVSHVVCSDLTPENQIQESNLPIEMWAPARRSRIVKQETDNDALKPIKILFTEMSSSPSFGVLNFEPSTGTDKSDPSFAMTFVSPDPSTILHTVPNVDVKAPTKKPVTRRKQPSKPPVFSLSGNSNTRDVTGVHQTPSQPSVRRSSRFTCTLSSVKENNKLQTKPRLASPKGIGRKSKTRTSKSQLELNEVNKPASSEMKVGKVTTTLHDQHRPNAEQVFLMQQQSVDGVLKLLLCVGKAYSALAQYECRKAIHLFEDLPPHQHNTAWVLAQVGQAYFEKEDFQKAVAVYLEMRRLEPYQLLGMDRYSTALWHMHYEVELSALAQSLSQLDRTSPQTWCATGNCFSLQKEHELAIKFFRRAIQVDADYAYAYTLLAHEYVFIEELDKALACFRNGLRVDSRHYNAWYGVGLIYYKQEKFSLAEVHFRRALAINPQSSALMCHVGVAQHAQKKTEQALTTLDRAIGNDPRNSLCKFHKASILLASDRHKEALKELEELQQIIPSESLVYFLMGKVHKKLGNTHLALMNFSWAMDLDPKGVNNQIKEAIDKRYVTDEDSALARLGDSLPDVGSCFEGDGEGHTGSSQSLSPDDTHPDLQAIESDDSL